MKTISLFSLLFLIFSSLSYGAEATAIVSIQRSYIDWTDPHGRIYYETICQQKIILPIHDFSKLPEDRFTTPPTLIVCKGIYRDQTVPVVVKLRNEIVLAKEFGLSGDFVKRIAASLYLDVGSDFPYLQEVQTLSGQQTFYRDISRGDSIFTLSPPEFLEIVCSQENCHAMGPQAIFRAAIEIQQN